MPKTHKIQPNKKNPKLDQYSLTTTQLEQISLLLSEIRKNAKDHNQIWARLSTAFLYMTFCYLYFFSDSRVENLTHRIENLNLSISEGEGSNYQAYTSFLETLCSRIFPNNSQVGDTTNYFENCLIFALRKKNIPESLIQQQEDLVFSPDKMMQSFMKRSLKLGAFYSEQEKILFTESGLPIPWGGRLIDNDMSWPQIYKLLKNKHDHFLKITQEYKHYDNNLFHFCWPAALLVQKSIVSPALNYYFPNGLFLSPTPATKKPIHLLSQDEARSYARSLKVYKQSANYRTNICKNSIRMMSVMFLWMLLSDIFLGESVSTPYFMLYLSIGYVAVSNLIQDVQDYWQHRQFPSELNEQVSRFQKIVEDHPAEVIPILGERLSTTLITINFKGPMHSKPEKSARMLQACFSHHGIDILGCKGTQIILQANLNVSKKTALIVNQLLDDHLHADARITDLENQFTTLLKCCGVCRSDLHYESSYDYHFIPIIKISCKLSYTDTDAYGETIFELFGGNAVKFSPHENHVRVVIKGNQPADYKEFSLTRKKIMDKKQRKTTPSIFKSKPAGARGSLQAHPNIHWNSGIFQFNSDDNDDNNETVQIHPSLL